MYFLPNPLIIPVGIIIGILVAAPVGPVNVLCIQRAIERGFWGGIAAGLGAMLGDGLIAFCAAMGVGAISGAVQYHRMAIQVLGGLVLAAFGLRLYLSKPRFVPVTAEITDQPETLRDFVWDIPQTFLLTITNPGAVLGLFAIFGGVSTFVEVRNAADALVIVAAVMGGSLAWWVSLSHLIARFRHRLSLTRLQLINQVAGLLLVGFGLLLIGEVVFKRLGVL
jgi:threonine/homoserine/homoserine lactone efflux protein